MLLNDNMSNKSKIKTPLMQNNYCQHVLKKSGFVSTFRSLIEDYSDYYERRQMIRNEQ